MFAHVLKLARGSGLGSLMLVFAASANAQSPPTASPKAFVLIEYQVRNKPLFLKLRDLVRSSLTNYKGELLNREKIQPIFGGDPTNLSIISFATVQEAKTWLASKELAALAPQREEAAKVSTYLVEKLD